MTQLGNLARKLGWVQTCKTANTQDHFPSGCMSLRASNRVRWSSQWCIPEHCGSINPSTNGGGVGWTTGVQGWKIESSIVWSPGEGRWGSLSGQNRVFDQRVQFASAWQSRQILNYHSNVSRVWRAKVLDQTPCEWQFKIYGEGLQTTVANSTWLRFRCLAQNTDGFDSWPFEKSSEKFQTPE